MANTINADSGAISGITGIRTTADNTGNLALQSNGVTLLTIATNNTATFANNVTIAGTLSTGAQGISSASMPTGSVLQVVQTVKTDTFSTSSLSYVDITGFSVSITPKFSTSKILVLFLIQGGVDAAVQGQFFQLVRDSTPIFIGDAASSRPRVTGSIAGSAYSVDPLSGSYLDSPATTSTTTYKMTVRTNGGLASYINRSVADRDTANYDGRTASSIVVMEIAA